MYLGKVIGSIWGTRQAAGLEGLKLLKVRPISLEARVAPRADRVAPESCAIKDDVIVAADTLGAGPGEYVLVAKGSRVRDITHGSRAPIKAVVLAIVDSASIDLGEVS